MVREGLKGLTSNQKKLKESYKILVRKGGELRLLWSASFLVWLLRCVTCGLLGSVEQGPAILRAIHKERYTALYMHIHKANIIIIPDMIILIIQSIMDENK